MVIHELNIDGIDHSIYMKTSSKKAYYGLCSALLSGLSDAEQTQITNVDKKERKIVYFTDVIRCFEAVGTDSSPGLEDCICGKRDITDLYLIRNKSTLEEHIIGSTCARNWFNKITDGCKYCSRINKSGADCINCSGKMNLKSVFLKWKNTVIGKKEMVSFGKYKNILTYSQLCSDIKKKPYIDWCINESRMKENIKKRLQYFMNELE